MSIIETERDQISQSHPILKLSMVQFISFENVIKINRHKQEQSRFLLITSVGIFLLGKKKFPSGYRSSRIISYNELTKISVKNTDSILFYVGDHISLQIVSKNVAKIVAYAYIIRTFLFGDIFLDVDAEMKNAIDTSPFLFESTSLLGDRFLSLCINEDLVLLTEQILSIYQILAEAKNEIVYTSDILSSPYLLQFTTAVSKMTAEFGITLKRGNFVAFMRQTGIILKENRLLEKLAFQNVVINGSNSQPIFQNCCSTSLKKISFKNCDLTHPYCKTFLNDLMHYKGNIYVLKLKDPIIDDYNLTSFFNVIFNAPCFRHINDLVFSGIQIKDKLQLLIIQLMGSNFVLSNKPLRKVYVNKSELAVDYVLPIINLFETGINKLKLTNCNFINALSSPGIPSFQQLNELDLSRTTCTSESLLSLFKALSIASSTPSNLLFNQLQISQNDLHKFYSNISNFVFNSLETFSWMNNSIDDSDLESFFNFIKNQPLLSDINISYSLQIKDTSKFGYIAASLQSLPLERFVMRGKGPTSYGIPFNDILRKFTTSDVIKGIDVHGQRISDIGIELLQNCIEKTLIAISFDSTGASINNILEILEEILHTNIESAEWPDDDIKTGLSKISITSKPEYSRRIDSIKKQYSAKFGIQFSATSTRIVENNNKPLTSLVHLRSGTTRFAPGLDRATSLKRAATSRGFDYEGIIAMKDDELETLLTECIGPESIQTKNDPLVVALHNINAMTGLKYA